MSDQSNANSDTFRILLATDNHLGYAEKDAVRGKDSLITFEEILTQAKNLKVDFILLGGDLFHENKPSRTCMHSCLHLLRKYCLGDDPVRFELISNPNENFKHNAFPIVNYEDSNLNVSIPIFSIHGNHDDPAGGGQLSSMDILSVTGYVNYFGKCLSLDDITITPLLMQKGETKLALYGLGSIRDERLHRAFIANKVKMLRPSEATDDWFNIFVLHQNRVRHGPTNFIPESFLDDFIDLVFWGHEHDCRIDPEPVGSKKIFITQPGSSVATSLCPGEMVPKHVGLLEIRGKEMRLTKIPLETVRPFYFDDIILSDTSLDLTEGNVTNKVMSYCSSRINELIQRAEFEHSGNENQPKKPLIRLRVEYEDTSEMFSHHRFGQRFVDQVANPKDMILFKRKRKPHLKDDGLDEEAFNLAHRLENLEVGNISAVDLVKEYFGKVEDKKKKMLLLTEKMFGESIQEFVDKEEREAINVYIEHQVKKCQDYLQSKPITNEEDLNEYIERYRSERVTTNEDDDDELQEVIREARKQANENPESDDEAIMSDEDEDEISESPTPRGRGRGRARGSRSTTTTRGSTRGRTLERARAGASRARGGRGRASKSSTASTPDVSSFFDTRSTRSGTRSGTSFADSQASKRARLSTSQKGVIYSDDESDFDF